jgi:hypothetical protein
MSTGFSQVSFGLPINEKPFKRLLEVPHGTTTGLKAGVNEKR